jgi:glycosyltransferase involved in cell wall biosynthesis
MHKPVLVPRTKGISDYFRAGEILFFEPGSIDDLAAQIDWSCRHPAELRDVMEAGRKVYERHRWNREEAKLLDLVGRLTMDSAVASAGMNS